MKIGRSEPGNAIIELSKLHFLSGFFKKTAAAKAQAISVRLVKSSLLYEKGRF